MSLGLPQKELDKVQHDLLELHKRCLENYLIIKSLPLKKRRKFFMVYNYYVNEDNIHQYFFYPISVFIRYLLRAELHKIENYTLKS